MMTERLDVVRGGTSPLFATNAPGGTVNAITPMAPPRRRRAAVDQRQ